jgi:hypothetical protein
MVVHSDEIVGFMETPQIQVLQAVWERQVRPTILVSLLPACVALVRSDHTNKYPLPSATHATKKYLRRTRECLWD